MQSLKVLWDGVDAAQKGWTTIIAGVAAGLPLIGVRSSSMRLALEGAVFAGLLLGYWFTVGRWAGKGRNACLARRTVYLSLCAAPFLVVIAMLVVLEPETAQSLSAQGLHDFLVSSSIVPNVIAAGGAFLGVYLLVGAIVLTSSKLWTYVFPP